MIFQKGDKVQILPSYFQWYQEAIQPAVGLSQREIQQIKRGMVLEIAGVDYETRYARIPFGNPVPVVDLMVPFLFLKKVAK